MARCAGSAVPGCGGGAVAPARARRHGPAAVAPARSKAALRPFGRRLALARQVRRLSAVRTEVVDAQAAELRRIERDLHDGAQARLVAVGMMIGTAERLLDTDRNAARAMLAKAREASADALHELRRIVRGIHPPVLAERGLGDAVRALALDCPLPTHVTIDLPARARRRSSPRRTSRSASSSATRHGTPARPGPGSTSATTAPPCGSRSPMTAGAAPIPRAAPGCAASSAGSARSTASSPSAARPAAPPLP